VRGLEDYDDKQQGRGCGDERNDQPGRRTSHHALRKTATGRNRELVELNEPPKEVVAVIHGAPHEVEWPRD
jgi:hypothetical protein